MRIVGESNSELRWPRQFTCPKCSTLLELDLTDIKRNTCGLEGTFQSWFIDCPVCREQPDVPNSWWSTVTRLKDTTSCARAGHDPDMNRWLVCSPGGLYGPNGDIPRSLNPCKRCGAFVETEPRR